jgi:transcriptional regulator with XRE-family HTH domain
MGERAVVLLPKIQSLLETVGENLKLARRRRKLTAHQVAERAGITRTTLWQVEKGAGGVSMATYAQLLLVLGLENDLKELAKDDKMGRRIQDAKLITPKRASKK